MLRQLENQANVPISPAEAADSMKDKGITLLVAVEEFSGDDPFRQIRINVLTHNNRYTSTISLLPHPLAIANGIQKN